jgi:hypothetical protein
MAASGGPDAVTLVELVTQSGNFYAWSDADVFVASVLLTVIAGAAPYSPGPGPIQGEVSLDDGPIEERPPVGTTQVVNFLPWVVSPAVVTQFKSVQTDTAKLAIQNLTGDTLRRDGSTLFSQQEFYGALVYIRIWNMAGGFAELSFQGNVNQVTVNDDGDSMSLACESTFAFSKISAPREQVGTTCGHVFNGAGSFYACGSVSATPCSNSYGTCSSLNRFKGIINDWAGSELNYSQIAQPPPLTAYNPKVKG